MKIRTAIFSVYITVAAMAFAGLLVLVLRDVRLRYVESMRRTLGDTAVVLAVLAGEGSPAGGAWVEKFSALPHNEDLLRVFACDLEDRVVFDSADGKDVGRIYAWPDRGGGRFASENYSLFNVGQAGDELRVRARVRIGEEVVGWVGVGRPLSRITEGVSEARWRLVRYTGAIVLTMTLAGWWVASRLTRSLDRLTDYVIALRDGKRAVVPEASRATEIATLARAFEEMRVTLEGKAHVERYTQSLAHELKAPLSGIRGAAELLSEEMPREDRLKFLGNLRAESDRLHQIVDRLLELSALEARRDDASQQEVDLGQVVSAVVTQAQVAAGVKKIGLRQSVEASVRLKGDAFLLSQAVSNLLQNALEFTPAGGTIVVKVTEGAGLVCVSVEDTGPGVPDYAREKIFDRFYSLPRPDTGRKSSGLGLSIVREIARLHGGEVSLENRAEGGARAILSLPLVRPGRR